tara:strand:- start:1837 stop:4368 length:2532 start_codon:yes stop_codon:yes gene_type:complete
MILRLFLLNVLFSISFSYTFDYVIKGNNFDFIDNHLKIKKANSTILIDKIVYDIHRIELIIANLDDINYTIKKIKWVKTDQKLSNFNSQSLLKIGKIFSYRNCPYVYIDIFPYKVEDDILYYIDSIEIEFNIDETKIKNSCYPSDKVLNKSFLTKDKLKSTKNNEIDYLVITNDDLFETAKTLEFIHNDLHFNIISLNSIISLYPDLDEEYAIREYVLSQIEFFPNLNYLLIIGDETIIPPIYNGSSPSDDYYSSSILFAANPQLSTGRIPVINNLDAINILENIQNYIQNLYFPLDDNSLWRMSINLVSDDENNPNPNKYPEISHTFNSNLIYEQINKNFITKTFYGINYEPVQYSGGLLHSQLTEDLIEDINNGLAMINYIGHGDYNTLADEKILELSRDINSFNIKNYNLPIWVVGTCSFGQYDGQDSMAEALLLEEKSSIAIVSTTRGIGETSNINFLTKFFNQINDYIDVDSDERRLGDIIRDSKNNSSSEHLFHLFGDPALPLPFPKKGNFINNDIPENLLIGSETYINVGMNEASISVFDKEKSITKSFLEDTITFKSQGQNIYYGNFYNDVCFLTPIDASACEECASIYIQLKDTPLNFSQNIFDLEIILNQENNEINFDNDGPEISFLTEDSRSLKDGDLIFENSHIIVEVEDFSGINLMDGLGHNIRYWFNNEQNQNIVNNQDFLYTSNCDSVYVGQFEVKLENLDYGLNRLYVEIWDNFNNKSTNSINLMLEQNSFKAFDVFNFPNPFKEKTFFTFKTSTYPVNVNINIFDLSGKKIKSIKNYECLTSFCSVEWDGKDKYGKKINNGTYIYNLNINNENYRFNNLYKLSKLK